MKTISAYQLARAYRDGQQRAQSLQTHGLGRSLDPDALYFAIEGLLSPTCDIEVRTYIRGFMRAIQSHIEGENV